ncbi:PCDHGA [Acanthosepion pharaonis]|uniref:PCDHGA n=1 Tax=Acanthosepion pharaonis TaxID=158019 RepID=A0A812E0D9_ACAPH|nr:PCDHGA [Sepia pharaonis]
MQDHHDVTISCKDEGSPPQHSDSKFSIKVKDVNDVRPQFAKDTFKFSVFENEHPKTPVGSINATDPDLGAGSRLTYSLLTKNEDFLPFKITSDGLISTIMSLDHEFKDIYKFKVLVKDNGSPPLDNTVNVIVEIEDKNDNAPYFTFPSVNPYNLDVKYHTKNITLLKAADSDSQENAFLKYEITKGNDKQLFAINHYTGLLSFSRLLSHQDAGSYRLQFMVKDSGSPVLSSKKSVILTLAVSNNTADMLNAAHMHTDIKIHQYLLIVIVLVAVTVAIPITAAISICILRCIDTRSVAHAHPLAAASSKYYPDQAHPMHPSYQTTYWSGVSVAVRAEQDVLCRTLPGRGRRPQHCADVLDDGRRSSALGIKVQTATEVIYEQIRDTTGGKRHEERNYMASACHPDKVRSSHTDKDQYDERSSNHCQNISKSKMSDTSDYYEPHSSQSIQEEYTDMKPSLQTFISPGDTRTFQRVFLLIQNYRCYINLTKFTPFWSGGRRPQHCADVLDDGRRSSALGIKVQTATEVIYEEIRGATGGKRHEDRNCMASAYHPDMEPTSHPDKEDPYAERYANHCQNVSVSDTSDYYEPHSSQSIHEEYTDMKPSLQTFMSPGDTRTVPRRLYKADANPSSDYRQWSTLKHSAVDRCTSDTQLQLHNVDADDEICEPQEEQTDTVAEDFREGQEDQSSDSMQPIQETHTSIQNSTST